MDFADIVDSHLRQARELLGAGSGPEPTQLQARPTGAVQLPAKWEGDARDAAAEDSARLADVIARREVAQTQAFDAISASSTIGSRASRGLDAIEAQWNTEKATVDSARATPESRVVLLRAGQDSVANVAHVVNDTAGEYSAAAAAVRDAQRQLPLVAEPTAHVDPKKPDPPTPYVPCWIGSAAANIAAVCPVATTDVYWMDKDGYWHKNIATGQVDLLQSMGPNPVAPEICYLPSADADRSICGPKATQWQYPGADGSLVTEIRQVPKTDIRIIKQPPGLIGPDHEIIVRP